MVSAPIEGCVPAKPARCAKPPNGCGLGFVRRATESRSCGRRGTAGHSGPWCCRRQPPILVEHPCERGGVLSRRGRTTSILRLPSLVGTMPEHHSPPPLGVQHVECGPSFGSLEVGNMDHRRTFVRGVSEVCRLPTGNPPWHGGYGHVVDVIRSARVGGGPGGARAARSLSGTALRGNRYGPSGQ